MADWFDEGEQAKSPVDTFALLSDLHEDLARLTKLGAMVSLFASSDGGALGLSVTCDGRSRRTYGREYEDFVEFVHGATEAMAAEAERRDRSPRRRSRSRRD